MHVLLMQVFHLFKLGQEFRQDRPGQGNGPVLFPLAVMYGQHAGVEIEIMDPQLQALKQPKSATSSELSDEGSLAFLKSCNFRAQWL
jgi:hypothetical protein